MFKDPWIPKELTFKPICMNYNEINAKVSDFITPSGGWDLPKLKLTVPNSDYETIRSLPINKYLSNKLIWH